MITNFPSDIYFNFFQYISPKDALNLKKTCKTINTLLSLNLFSKNTPSCQDVFKKVYNFSLQYPDILDSQSFRMNLVARVLYDDSYLKEKIHDFIQESCARLMVCDHHLGRRDSRFKKKGFFENEKLFLWLEEQGFIQSISTMQYTKYIKEKNDGAIQELCLMVRDFMKAPFHDEAVKKIFDQTIVFTLERVFERLKKTILVKPYLLDILKNQIILTTPLIDWNKELVEVVFREMQDFISFFGEGNVNKNIERVSDEFLLNGLKKVVHQIENEQKHINRQNP